MLQSVPSFVEDVYFSVLRFVTIHSPLWFLRLESIDILPAEWLWYKPKRDVFVSFLEQNKSLVVGSGEPSLDFGRLALFNQEALTELVGSVDWKRASAVDVVFHDASLVEASLKVLHGLANEKDFTAWVHWLNEALSLLHNGGKLLEKYGVMVSQNESLFEETVKAVRAGGLSVFPSVALMMAKKTLQRDLTKSGFGVILKE